MADSLDTELDRLFQLPAEQLVVARNLLAGELRKAGDRDAAAAVKALKRPTPAAWALNQVHFREPELLQAARAQSQRLRELHAADGVDPVQLSTAFEAQRNATHAIVDAALDHCQNAGVTTGPALQRRLFSCVQGWLSGRSSEAPGRMTQDIEAGGFDALESVGEALPRAPLPAASSVPAPSQLTPPQRPPIDLRHERAKRDLAEAERAARTAAEQLRQRTSECEARQRELDRSQAALLAAEAALVRQRALVAGLQRNAADAGSALEAAQTANTHAEARSAQARAALAAFVK